MKKKKGSKKPTSRHVSPVGKSEMDLLKEKLQFRISPVVRGKTSRSLFTNQVYEVECTMETARSEKKQVPQDVKVLFDAQESEYDALFDELEGENERLKSELEQAREHVRREIEKKESVIYEKEQIIHDLKAEVLSFQVKYTNVFDTAFVNANYKLSQNPNWYGPNQGSDLVTNQ